MILLCKLQTYIIVVIDPPLTLTFLFNDYRDNQPSRFCFYKAEKPMYTSRRNLPPSNIDNSKIVYSIVSHR
ncbi:hypothetical protein Ahy_B01g056809 isoform C [Arachis hypogaea]|uniref:Uncharacterized protein n=1 Tax=Arachis hypogaea TaxID=3818 RepID=A0A445AZK1_ARAHY|nr:hypothetical protein Ahy_B01g056809 isoform C [Arachis hypogaea]